MTVTEQARRADALYYENVSKRELCDRIARLESLLEVMPYCWNGYCDRCPMLNESGTECKAESELKILGIRTVEI